MEKQRGRAGVGYGDGGGAGRAWLSLRRGRQSRKWEMRRGMARAGAGDVKAALGHVVAWLGRAEATHGRFSSMRRPWPDGGRPLNQPIQFVSRATPSLTTSFDTPLTANPLLLSRNCMNTNCRTMSQLQLWFKALVLIRNRNREKCAQGWLVRLSGFLT